MAMAMGSVVPDPKKETREEFLKRVQQVRKTPMAKVVEKAKAIPGLWELWGPEEAQRPAKRGRTGRNAQLKERLLEGGEVETLEEYEKVPALIKLSNQQHARLMKAGKAQDAQEAFEATQKLFAAADRWADANQVTRIRRVEGHQRSHEALFRAGLQMIAAAFRGNAELLTNELRLGRDLSPELNSGL